VLVAAFASLVIAAAPQKVASPGLKVVNLPAETGDFYSEHLALQLGREGLRVITGSEIRSLLGMERQKQLLGCSDESSNCMAELADALGANALLVGSVGKFGSVYQINLRVLSNTGTELAAFASTAATEPAVLEELTRGARALASQMRPPDITLRRWSWVPAAGGAVLGGAGAIMLGQAAGWHSALVGSGAQATPLATARQYRDQGPVLQGAGLVLAGVGAAAIGVAAWMFFAHDAPKVALIPTPAGLAVSGGLP
jgi:hypothetical protein